MVEESAEQSAERVYNDSEFYASVRESSREWFQRPFPGEAHEAHYEIKYLEYRHGLDGAVKIVRYKVPENFWPDEAFY